VERLKILLLALPQAETQERRRGQVDRAAERAAQIADLLRLPRIDVQSPDPEGLAAHWARIIDLPVTRNAQHEPTLLFELGAVRFVSVPAGSAERLDALHIEVADAERTCAAARALGCASEGQDADRGFVLAGVRWVPHSRSANTER
jgi:hypothetical protein